MNQKNKELLLKDLSARLPYGVIIEGLEHSEIMTIKHLAIISVMSTEPYKPYLRPMSSMTEEEKKEFIDATDGELRYSEVFDVIKPMRESEDYCASFVSYLKAIDWLNAHHFDYRGLIEKGLAIEVTEDNNPYKEL